jgi:galactose mutarotase-like enzyme
MHSISNNLITIQVASKGAELQSIYCNKTSLEYIWSGDEAFWPKKSPVLFPIVGGLKNNTYKHNGKSYKLPRHGFARDMEFELTASTDSSLTFTLTSNEQTKAVYPFDFVFSITYSLEGAALHITFKVTNTGDAEHYFSVGAHPAFAVPVVNNLDFKDYYLQFSEFEVAGKWPLTKEGLIENFAVPFLDNINHLHLTKEMFAHDAIVFKNLHSNSITIKSEKLPNGVKVSFKGFPYMGIWSAKGADFVCIEPWCGIADTVDSTGELSEKEGMIKQSAGESFTRTYTIEVF